MMKEIQEFLKVNNTVFLATVEAGRPRVRPFQYLFETEGKLFFCTAKSKEVYRQLSANPNLEFAVTSPEYVTLRVSGSAEFCDCSELKQRVLDENPMIKSIYGSADNPTFTLFYLAAGEAVFADFSGQPPRQIKF